MKCKYLCSLWKIFVFWTQRLHLKLLVRSRAQFYWYAPIQSELGSAVGPLPRLCLLTSQHEPEQTHQKSWNGRKWSKTTWWSTPADWGGHVHVWGGLVHTLGSVELFTTGGLDNKVYLSRILDVLQVLGVEACVLTRKWCLMKVNSSVLKYSSETNSE